MMTISTKGLEDKKINSLSKHNANAVDLSKSHQSHGRLMALLTVPLRLKNYNYLYWLAICDHGIGELSKAIAANIEFLIEESQKFINQLILNLTKASFNSSNENNQLPKIYHHHL